MKIKVVLTPFYPVQICQLLQEHIGLAAGTTVIVENIFLNILIWQVGMLISMRLMIIRRLNRELTVNFK